MSAITCRARIVHGLRATVPALGMLVILGLGIVAAWAMLLAVMPAVTVPAYTAGRLMTAGG